MMRLYSGCGTRRLTSTTMVFCIPVDTTCPTDRKSTRLNSSHGYISYAVFCLKKQNALPVFRSGGVILDHAGFLPSIILVASFTGFLRRVRNSMWQVALFSLARMGAPETSQYV